jgi:cytochrome oxidase assembly protein ShyY1
VYRFLLSRRWAGLFALALVVAICCGLLARWQWHRREQRLAYNAPIIANYDRDAVDAQAVLGDGRLDPDELWTPVQLQGHYVADATTLVRNRPQLGQAAYEVLVPFVTGHGVVIVDRGWLPTGRNAERPDEIPAPPTGQITLTARVLGPESADERQAPLGEAYRISPADLAPAMAARSHGAFAAPDVLTVGYLQLAAEQPAAAANPVPFARPQIDEGPHLSYSVQWVIFGIGAIAGVFVLARRTAEDLADPGAAREARPRRRRDEDEEDALLDAAEAAGRVARDTPGDPP